MKKNSTATPTSEHQRDGDQQAGQQADSGVHRQLVAEVGAEDDHHALRDVDDVHDAEDQRQTGGHERIHAAGQDAIDDRLDEGG